jgi:hypothetical protein
MVEARSSSTVNRPRVTAATTRAKGIAALSRTKPLAALLTRYASINSI